MQITTIEDKVQVMLEGELTVANAAELKNLLLEALAAKGDHIEVNLEGVTGLDLSFMQMMCSAARTARNRNKELSLTGTKGGVLLQARKAAGYIRQLGCNYNPTTSCIWVGGLE
jgi:anti-anti-sigma factor